MRASRKNDIGEKIRSNLVCPLVALEILKEFYSKNKVVSKKIIQFVNLAKNDISLIVDLSWKVSQGRRWQKSSYSKVIAYKEIRSRAQKLKKLARKINLFGS